MHEIVDRLRGLPVVDQLPFTYGYAVAFPDCRYSGSTASIVPDQVLDGLNFLTCGKVLSEFSPDSDVLGMPSFRLAKCSRPRGAVSSVRAYSSYLAQGGRSRRASAPPYGGATEVDRLFGQPHQGCNPRRCGVRARRSSPWPRRKDRSARTSYPFPLLQCPLKDWLIAGDSTLGSVMIW